MPAHADTLTLSGCRLQPAPAAPTVVAVACDAASSAAVDIARIAFEVSLFKLGRDVPMSTEIGVYDVPGGILPGETVPIVLVIPKSLPSGVDLESLVPQVKITRLRDVEGHPIP